MRLGIAFCGLLLAFVLWGGEPAEKPAGGEYGPPEASQAIVGCDGAGDPAFYAVGDPRGSTLPDVNCAP